MVAEDVGKGRGSPGAGFSGANAPRAGASPEEGVRVRRYSELNDREKSIIYIAAWLLHYYGYGPRRVRRILLLLYGIDVPRRTLCNWFYNGERPPRLIITTFMKALFYHAMYKRALQLKREHPDWGYKRIATQLGREFPLKPPWQTVRDWVTGKHKPNVTPVRLEELEAIAYCVGVLKGDYNRTDGGLYNKDYEFVEFYAKMYEKATGIKPNIGRRKSRDAFESFERGGWLRDLARTGLWKVFAWLRPRWFLKGLFDSEGSVSPKTSRKKGTLDSVQISVSGSKDAIDFAESILKSYGFNVRKYYVPPQENWVKGELVFFGGCWVLVFYGWDQARRFADLIGFRHGERREKLNDLLRIRHLKSRERFRWWIQHYEKVNGRWKKKR